MPGDVLADRVGRLAAGRHVPHRARAERRGQRSARHADGDRADEPRAGVRRAPRGFAQVGDRSGLELGVSATQGTNNVAAGTRTHGLRRRREGASSGPRRARTSSCRASSCSSTREDAGWDSTAAAYTTTEVTSIGGYVYADYNFKTALQRRRLATSATSSRSATDRGITRSSAFAGFSLMEETTAFRLDWDHFMPGTPDGRGRTARRRQHRHAARHLLDGPAQGPPVLGRNTVLDESSSRFCIARRSRCSSPARRGQDQGRGLHQRPRVDREQRRRRPGRGVRDRAPHRGRAPRRGAALLHGQGLARAALPQGRARARPVGRRHHRRLAQREAHRRRLLARASRCSRSRRARWTPRWATCIPTAIRTTGSIRATARSSRAPSPRRSASVDPAHAADYRARAEAFAKAVPSDAWRADKAIADALAGARRCFTYHARGSYFAQRVRARDRRRQSSRCPGIPPTGEHLAELVDIAKARKVPVLLQEPYFSDDAGKFLAREAGVRVVVGVAVVRRARRRELPRALRRRDAHARWREDRVVRKGGPVTEAFALPFFRTALIASLVLAGIHAYLGLPHRAARRALRGPRARADGGARRGDRGRAGCSSTTSSTSYLLALGMTFVGAALFAWLRGRCGATCRSRRSSASCSPPRRPRCSWCSRRARPGPST